MNDTVKPKEDLITVEGRVERVALLDQLTECRNEFAEIYDKSYFKRKRNVARNYIDNISRLIENEELVNTDFLRFQTKTLRDLLAAEKAFDKNGMLSLGIVFVFFILNAFGGLISLIHWLAN